MIGNAIKKQFDGTKGVDRKDNAETLVSRARGGDANAKPDRPRVVR